jgi:hypothetical protein
MREAVEYGRADGGLGPGDSQAVRLSPDESLIYLSGGYTGRVAAAFHVAPLRGKPSRDVRPKELGDATSPAGSVGYRQ